MRFALLLLGMFAASTGISVSGAGAEPPPIQQPVVHGQPSGTCAAAQFVGNWTITSRVFAAKKASAAGVNGYYYLEVTGSGCRLAATLTKVGFSVAKGIREFPPHKRQKASGTLQLDRNTPTGQLRLSLTRPDGSHSQPIKLYLLADGGRIEAVWNYEGGPWKKTLMRGSMIGHRSAKQYPTHRKLGDVACVLQCTLHCGAVRPDGATLPESSEAGLSKCLNLCAPKPRGTVNYCPR